MRGNENCLKTTPLLARQPRSSPAQTEEWTGAGSYGPAKDFRAGAAAQCGDEVAFAYESGGLFGSLDLGSLGS